MIVIIVATISAIIVILLELYSNVRLERDVYIFVYSYLVRLILKELKKKRKIAYLSLSIKRFYNVRDFLITHIKR